MITRDQWLHEFFDRLAIRAGRRETCARAWVAMLQAEGSVAKNNPLDTTWVLPNSWVLPGNTAGVREYATHEDGMDASVLTISQRNPDYGYGLILSRMRDPDASAFKICRAIRKSAWGTGFVMFAVLADIRLRGAYWTYAGKEVV